MWLTIVKTFKTALDILRVVLGAIERSKAEQKGRDNAELNARREADRVSDAIADARNRLPDIADDPYNRDNRSNPLP